jgi:succinate dehydrogenase / fumarate reductase, cytochrome b subunit
MNWFTNSFTYSIGKKIIMSLTGLFLVVFLIVHLSGNLLLLKGDDGIAFNAYADFMAENMLVSIMRYVLLFGFLFHIVDGVILTIQNRKARGKGYAYNDPAKNSSWFSRNMFLTGSILFIFLIVHLRAFMVEYHIIGTEASLYELVKSAFENVYYSLFYVIAMALLGFHLVHGFKSAFQSLGLNHVKYNGLIKNTGILLAILLAAGFAVIPVYFYLAQF